MGDESCIRTLRRKEFSFINDYLNIKVLDSGLYNNGNVKTFCSSKPRVSLRRHNLIRTIHKGYRCIWSLGVVILRFAYSLPYSGSGSGIEWCETESILALYVLDIGTLFLPN